jgi:hypothetical protein
MMNPKASKKSELQVLSQPLNFSHQYPCPVCRHGKIEGLFWVEAFSCGFCRHIFTVDSPHQYFLHLEDSAQPLKWRWTGDHWVSARSSALTDDSRLLVWVMGVAFVLLPTALIWFANYIFPPLPQEGSASFSWIWTGLTFLAHGSIVVWFCLEYYQIPVYLILKLYLRRLFQLDLNP